ncbi:MAG: hypothetical protein P1V97_01565 [Planctomycetota bacterium]|nr:hypothetical protein [Planctomycetota bacterium]
MSKLTITSLSLLTFIALTSTAQAQGTEEKTKTVTITKKAYAKGDVISVARSFEMDMKMTITMPPQGNQPPAPPQVTDQKGSNQDDRLLEILEVKKGKITKVKLTFEKKVQTMDMGPQMGGAQERPDSLDKLSFTIEKVGDTWSIVNKDGPVAEGDMQKIKRLTKPIFDFQGNSLAEAIPAKTLKVGAEIKADVEVLKDLLDMRNQAFKFSEHKLVLTGTKKINGKDHALFDVKFSAQNEGGAGAAGAMVMKISGDGKLVVDVATGRQRSLTLSGSPKMDSKPNAQFSMHGDGEIKIEEKVKLESKDEEEKEEKKDK